MATGEELVYPVRFDTERLDATDLIDPSVIRSLAELSEEIQTYRDGLKALKKAQADGMELDDEQLIIQERLKLRIKEVSGEYNRQQRDLVKLESGNKSLGVSYNDLTKKNAELSVQMRNLPIGDTTGELQKLQAQYNANNEVLKQFDKAMGNNQRNVGNYESALNGLGGVLSTIPGGVGDIIQTFQKLQSTLTAVSGAFATKETVIKGFTASTAVATTATAAYTSAETAQATAVTASAGAIGFDTTATTANTVATTGNTTATVANATAQTAQAGAATASATAIGTTTVAQRALNLVMKANPVLLVVSAVAALIAAFSSLQPVMDRIKQATAALGAAFEYVRDTVAGFLTGEALIRESFTESIRKTIEYTKRLQELEQAKLQQDLKSAEARKIIAQLRLDAQDETKTIEERAKALKDARIIEQNDTIARLNDLRAEIEATEALDDLSAENLEKKKNLTAMRVQLSDLETASLKRERELQSEINTLDNKFAAEEKARVAEQERLSKQATAEIERQLAQRKLALDAYRNAILSMNDTMEMALLKQNELLINNPLEAPELELDTNRAEQVLSGAYDLGVQLAEQTVQQAVVLGDQMAVLELQQLEDLRQRKLYYLSLNYTDAEAAQQALTDMSVMHAQERARKEVEIERSKSELLTQTLLGFANTAINIGTALFGKSKAIAIAEAIISTYAGAASALRINYGTTPLALAAKFAGVAAVISNGLKQVATIARTSIGGGVNAGGAQSAAVTTSTRVMSGFAVTEGTQTFAAVNDRAASIGAQASERRQSGVNITIDAKVDRKGLALAVRDGETEIRTEQFTYI
jgi:hypothetical protein